MMQSKIAILPCTGVGQVLGTVTRQAAYLVCDDRRPEDTALVCLPALVKGVQEDIDMIREWPVVVIEGCRERCGTHALATRKGSAAATVFLPDLMRKRGLSARSENRSCPGEQETRLAEAVAEEVVAIIDRFKSGKKV